MGQFKQMVKMMTTEPSVELKLKKGGAVKKADGGMMAMPSSMPAAPARGGMMAARAPMRPPLAARRKAMAMPAKAPAGVPAPASPVPAMKKGGDAMQALKKHADKPASKAHKGLKTGGVVMGQGGFKAGGIIGVKASEKGAKSYVKTKMHDGGSEDHTPKKTGGIRNYAKGGGVEGNVSSTPPGVTNTSTGEVRKGNAGGFKKGGKIKMAMGGVPPGQSNAGGAMRGLERAAQMSGRTMPTVGRPDQVTAYKKGGSAKKAYATGGLVDTGKPVAMPKKAASKPVRINELAGTFKKGGSVKKADGGEVLMDASKGAYDKSIGPSQGEMDMAKTIRSIPRKLFRGAKSLIGMDSQPPKGSVTETEKSVTVAPAKKRGGAVKC